ncbi:hypothetical protein DID78_04905 [Candidatus Marinamargulisbacteria bacterium SCGC AG-343-D04]|nr:hypothetical protein DID78_04905 [Candidatus Marinamargulisbacteria bacterium SCGC AG-343-D04]
MQKILIADDEANILMLLEIMLRDLDVDILSAENGEIAIELAKKEKPDLIISDVVMPKKNGFEVCREVRNSQDIDDTPIILLSALGDEYNKLTGFDEGANDYMIKPFNVEELKARAKSLLSRQKSKKKSPDPKPSTLTAQKVSTTPSPTSSPNQTANSLFQTLPKGSNILVVGPTGVGKSSFCRNFISEGINNKEKCLVIAIDDDPKKIRDTLKENISSSLQEEENKKNIAFVDAYSWSSLNPPENETFMLSGSLELNQLSGVISDASFSIGQSIQQKNGGRRIIDSLSSLLINFELGAVQQFINQIARTAVAFGEVTTLFVIEEGTVDETMLNNVKYIMDGVIEFKRENDEKQCRIASMKWADYSNHWIKISS